MNDLLNFMSAYSSELEFFVPIIGILIAIFIVYCIMVISHKENTGEKIINTIPDIELFKKEDVKEDNTSTVMHFLTTMTQHNGIKDDSIKGLFKDYVYVLLMCLFMGAILTYILKKWFIIPIMLFGGLFLPILARFFGKKAYRKAYLSSFYSIIDYIILYTSGGVNIFDAIYETEKLVSDDNPIKKSMQEAIKMRNISGVNGNSYVDSLYKLNEELHLAEIDDFIRSIALQAERGTPVVNTLYSQIDYIHQKRLMADKETIAKAESSITMLKTGLCSLPILLLFLIPAILSGIQMLG